MAKYVAICNANCTVMSEYDLDEFDISEEEAQAIYEGKDLSDKRSREILFAVLDRIGLEWSVKLVEESEDFLLARNKEEL